MNLLKILTLVLAVLTTSCYQEFSKKTKEIATKILPKSYQPDLVSGKTINDSQINKLNIGMSKSQVKSILGSADIIDPFHKNRWDYVNHSRIKGVFSTKTLTLIFSKNNTLSKIIK